MPERTLAPVFVKLRVVQRITREACAAHAALTRYYVSRAACGFREADLRVCPEAYLASTDDYLLQAADRFPGHAPRTVRNRFI